MSASSSGNMNQLKQTIDSNGTLNHHKCWSKCNLCKNKSFASSTQFGQHLRDYHCTKEGGSFVCRYGDNDICSSLPLEGVNDKDYESHIVKCHIFPKRVEPRTTFGITGICMNNADNNGKDSHSRDKRMSKRKSQSFPAPNESINTFIVPNLTQPNIVSDGLTKWNVYSSSQNLASVLNDPSKHRSLTDTIFTKDWGAYFVDTGSVPPSPFHPKISHAHFDSYMKKVIKRTKSQRTRIMRKDSLSLQTQSSSARNIENYVPNIFFNSDFSLENIEIFKSVLSLSANKDLLLGSSPLSPTKWNSVTRDSVKELQRNFSEYLDVVEENLARQISLRSQDFFQVMAAMETVMGQLIKTIKEVTVLRRKCEKLEVSLIKPSLRNIQLTKARNNATDVIYKIKLMATVHQTQPTIQLLLSSFDFVGSLDLISTSQEVVTQELSGINSFRHLKLQLMEIEKVIDQMMKEEFIKYLTSEFNRPFDFEEEKYSIEEERLLAIVFGMLRIQCFNFIGVFQEEACTAVKAVVKQTVIETLSNEDDIEVGMRIDGSLFDMLRSIEFPKWIQLLNRVFNHLLIVIRRIHSVQTVMAQGFASHTDRDINQLHSIDNIASDGTVDTSKMLLEGDCIELTSNLRESLCAICDFAHSKSANIIESRAKDGGLDKLSSAEFVSLAKSVETFSVSCQMICGRMSPNLKLALQTQANKFASRFHEERKKRLNANLDIERWKSMDSFTAEFQDIVNQIIEKGVNFNDIVRVKINGDHKPKPYLMVNGQKFFVVNAVVTLINMTIEYCQCASEIKTLSPDLLTRLLDLLKQFNARTSQLVLGAGALQVAGLRTISARNLIVSSRCLQLVIVFIPYVNTHFESLLPPKQKSMCKHFDEILRAYKEHILKIPEKLISMVKVLIEDHLSKWEAKPPVPSPQFNAISQHLIRLHDNVHDTLPLNDLVDYFKKIHDAFKEVLRTHLMRLKIVNDGGPQHGLVIQELTFHNQNMRKLSVSKYVNFSNDDLWNFTKNEI